MTPCWDRPTFSPCTEEFCTFLCISQSPSHGLYRIECQVSLCYLSLP
jgi:hypothetical protein